MEKRFDVVALGELLIDFTESGVSSQGNNLFEACPGGAPCNVLAMLRKTGKRCAFIGKVGDDMFGRYLRDTIVAAGINADGLVMDPEIPTTLAFVKTFANGDRDFSFYRKPGADMMLTEQELPEEMLADSRIFHFGTLSMTHPGVRAATIRAIELARKSGGWISFDPNLRPPLWNNLEAAREQIAFGLSKCDILKIADNELLFMTGEADFYRGAAQLHSSGCHLSQRVSHPSDRVPGGGGWPAGYHYRHPHPPRGGGHCGLVCSPAGLRGRGGTVGLAGTNAGTPLPAGHYGVSNHLHPGNLG